MVEFGLRVVADVGALEALMIGPGSVGFETGAR